MGKGNFIVQKSGGKQAEASAPAEASAAAEADMKKEAEVAKKAKDEKKPKKTESAGISKAERDELESLKQQIIKEQGMSGGQCNKDPEVVTMVARMQELKIKEDPTSAEGDKKEGKKKEKKLSAESEAEKKKLEEEIEEYRIKLQTEFKYTKKEINADPDMQDLLAKMKAFK